MSRKKYTPHQNKWKDSCTNISDFFDQFPDDDASDWIALATDHSEVSIPVAKMKISSPNMIQQLNTMKISEYPCKKCGHVFALRKTRDLHQNKCTVTCIH
jgi:hypothetical protein